MQRSLVWVNRLTAFLNPPLALFSLQRTAPALIFFISAVYVYIWVEKEGHANQTKHQALARSRSCKHTTYKTQSLAHHPLFACSLHAAGDILIACKTPVYVCAVPENMRLIKITAAKNDSACVLGPSGLSRTLERDKSRNEKS